MEELRATLNPVRLLQEIRAAQQQLVEIADRPVLGEAVKPTAPTLEQFLSGLRTAWQDKAANSIRSRDATPNIIGISSSGPMS
jgi:hypothetical protein